MNQLLVTLLTLIFICNNIVLAEEELNEPVIKIEEIQKENHKNFKTLESEFGGIDGRAQELENLLGKLEVLLEQNKKSLSTVEDELKALEPSKEELEKFAKPQIDVAEKELYQGDLYDKDIYDHAKELAGHQMKDFHYDPMGI